MIWTILIICVGLASARNVRNVSPEYLKALRSSGQDAEFARLLGVDVSLVRPNPEERAEASWMNMRISPLGDILIDEEQERQGVNFKTYPGSRWPNGTIPYTIIESDFNDDLIKTIIDGINDWNKKIDNCKLMPHSGEDDYVTIFAGNGCWSYLGRIGGQQPLCLQKNGCVTIGTVQHEFEHAAGCHHEHNREDRDLYLTVLWGNIPEEWHPQYRKVSGPHFINITNCYDYDSVMQYPIWAPGNRANDAFALPDGIDRNRLGQNVGVSPGDIEKMNILYSESETETF